jgi:hypothetical protein
VADLDVYEGGGRFFQRTYDARIPRDHC